MEFLLINLLLQELPLLESKKFTPELQQQALLSTVRIRNVTNSRVGSGSFIGYKGKRAYILTANHVIQGGKKFQVETFTKSSYPASARKYPSIFVEVVEQPGSSTPDLALMRVILPNSHEKPIALPLPCQEHKNLPKKFQGLTVGCTSGKAPTLKVTQINGYYRIQREGIQFGQHWKTKQAAARGRSGGPLLNSKGEIVGVCSGVGDGQGYYIHFSEMRNFLKRGKFEWLVEKSR